MKVNTKKKNTKGVVSISVLLFLSMIIYLFRQKEDVGITYNYLCFALLLITIYIYFKSIKKNNFLDFDTIFILILAIIGFVYPVFLYSESSPFIFFYGLSFNTSFINSGTIFFLLGLQSYFLGSLSAVAKKNKKKQYKTIISTSFLILSVIVLSVLFVLLGGVRYYQAMYNEEVSSNTSPIAFQIMVLLHAFSIVVIATEFYNKKIKSNYKISKLLIITILGVVLLMLYAGNRTFASYLGLPIILLWTFFFKKINKTGAMIFFSLSFFLMFVIQSFRSGSDIEIPTNLGKSLSDLVIVSRATYSSIEYVDEKGFTYGLSMSGGFFGVIPSLESSLLNNTYLIKDDFGSAETLTRYTLGANRNVGLGTNLIADIYMSFGLPGLLFFMFILGRFIRLKTIKSLRLDYYSLISLTVMISYAAFLPRSSYSIPFKLLIWCYIIAKFNFFITNKK